MDPALGRYDNQEMLATCSVADWVHSNTILMLGTNIPESGLVYNRWFFDAKEAGAKMWTIDPHYTTAAGKSDEWMPIQPGTDAALLLGMISLVIENKWYDEGFMLKYTSFPFLIDKATGMLERNKQTKDAPEEGSGKSNPFKVWDGGVKNYDAAAHPQLEFENDKYITVFSQLKKNAAEYTLDWAAEKTHLDPDKITQMTDEFANNQPSVLAMGWGGPDKWYNADVVGHAAVTLAGLCGITDKQGGGLGGYNQWQVTYGCEFGEWPTPDDWGTSDGTEGNFERRDDDAGVHGYVALGDALLMHYADTNKTREWVNKLDFVLAVDIYHTFTCDWADIVLPASSKFELNEDIGSVKTARDYVELQQKVIDPLFESKPDYEIEYGLAKAMGCADALPKTRRELDEAMLASDDPALAGITVDSLIANNGLQRLNVPEEWATSYRDHDFTTPSGRMELYYDWLTDDGQQLPKYEDSERGLRGQPAHGQVPAAAHAGALQVLHPQPVRRRQVDPAVLRGDARAQPQGCRRARPQKRRHRPCLQRPRRVQVQGARQQRDQARLLAHLRGPVGQVHGRGPCPEPDERQPQQALHLAQRRARRPVQRHARPGREGVREE